SRYPYTTLFRSTFIGAHGLSDAGHVHDSHPYTITGILQPAHNVTDRLILSSIGSVWSVHGLHADDHHDHNHDDEGGHAHAHEHSHEQARPEHEHNDEHANDRPVLVRNMGREAAEAGPEITALLVQYRNPSA